MRKFKRTISFILCLHLLLQGFCIAHAESYPEEDGAYALLSGLGIAEGEKIIGDVSLSEAAALLINFSGNDVVDDAPAEAKQYGYISQNNNSVTVEEFAKGILIILGYGACIEKSGVMSAALGAGIMKGVNAGRGDRLKCEDAYTMLENALFASPMTVTSTKEFTVSGSSYLYEILKITKIEGLVTANFKTGLYNDEENEGSVSIDEKTYDCDKNYDIYLGYVVEAYINGDEELLYMTPKTNRNSISELSGADIVSASEGVVSYEEMTASKTVKTKRLKYRESIPLIKNGKYKGPLTKQEFDFSLNRHCEDTIYLFLDNDNDSTADVCIAKQYKYFRIEDIAPYYDYAVDKFSGKVLCFSEEDRFFFSDGKSTVSKSITPDSIIAVACTDEEEAELYTADSDRDGLDFYIISEQYGNQVNSFSEVSEGQYEMIIGGEEYKVNLNYGISPEKVASDNLLTKTVNIYVDMLGKVIAYEITNTDGIVYIKAIKKDKKDKYWVKVYSGAGGHEEKLLSENIKIEDPTPTVTEDNIDSVCREYAVFPKTVSVQSLLTDLSGKTVSQIKGYKLLEHNTPNLTGQLARLGCNEDGEVTRIYLPRQLCFGERGKDNEFNIVKFAVVLDRLRQVPGYENAKGITNSQKRRKVWMDTYRAGSACYTYYIPYDLDDTDNYRYAKTYVLNSGYVNVDASMTTELFIKESNGSYEEELKQVAVDKIPAIVTKVTAFFDREENVEKLKIDAYQGSKYVTFTTDELDLRSVDDVSMFNSAAFHRDIAAQDLRFGDIIQVNEIEGTMKAFRLLASPGKDMDNDNYMAYANDTSTYTYYIKDPFSGSRSFYSAADYRCGFAKVIDFNNTYMRTMVNNSGGRESNFWPSTFANRVVIDVDNKTVTPMGNYMMREGKIRAAFYYFLWGVDQVFYMYK